ncbi:MAG: DUF3352 domain-containing protein, partial [Candidatus Caldarchaeum sp.]
MKRNKGLFVPKIFAGLAITTVVAVAGVAVLNLFHRTGEAAVKLMPADAVLVVSFDNTPSPAQAVLFNRIGDAIKSSGMDRWIDDLLSQWDKGTGVLAELRSYVQGSFALAVFPSEDMKKPDGLLAVSLSNPGGAENLVREYMHSEVREGVRFYWGEERDGYLVFYETYALLSNKQEVILRALGVAKGKVLSVYDEASFQTARRVLPSDATLMVFLNGRPLAQGDQEAAKGLQALGIDREGWFALGITLRGEGIVVDAALPATERGVARALREAEALNFKGMARFPAGAVAILGVSNPARFFEFVLEVAQEDPRAAADAERGIREMEAKSNMSFEDEWLPAFRGEFVGALYAPAKAGENPHLILGLDNQHQGKATQFALKFFDKANAGQFDTKDKRPRFTTEILGEWKIFRPTDQPGAAFAVSDQQVLFVTEASFLREIMQGGPRGSNLLSESNVSQAVQEKPRVHLRLEMNQVLEAMERLGVLPPNVNLKDVFTGEDLYLTVTAEGQFARLHLVV